MNSSQTTATSRRSFPATLNRQVDGLPSWPKIIKRGAGTFSVEGWHISYGRFIAFLWFFRIGSLVGFYFLAKHLFDPRQAFWSIMYVLGSLIAYLLLTSIMPVARWLCWLLFRCHTRVVLTPRKIVVGRLWRNLSEPVHIQFRASQPRATDGDRGRFVRYASYLSRFRVVEMIYGLEIIPIASMADEHRAARFAVALQYAYGLARNADRSDISREESEDNLPE